MRLGRSHCVVLSRGIEPRPPPSEGDILSIKLRERFRAAHFQLLSLYYEMPDLVNRGADEDGCDDVEQHFLAHG